MPEDVNAEVEVSMAWYVYVAWLFAGAFLANAIPHTVRGICGNRFQTPFASPPGVGESSAIVNVIWGFANFAVEPSCGTKAIGVSRRIFARSG
jgi:hypothetical protein